VCRESFMGAQKASLPRRGATKERRRGRTFLVVVGNDTQSEEWERMSLGKGAINQRTRVGLVRRHQVLKDQG